MCFWQCCFLLPEYFRLPLFQLSQNLSNELIPKIVIQMFFSRENFLILLTEPGLPVLHSLAPRTLLYSTITVDILYSLNEYLIQ